MDCSNNQLISLPPLPSTLEIFYCYNNQLTSLPSLPSTLQKLYCFDNQLSHLPPLPSILQLLVCSRNQLTHLPLETINQWKFYSGFSRLKTNYQKDLAKKNTKKMENLLG